MTRLIITRHGQSIANAECRFAGHSDFDLSPIGHTQAALAAEYISKTFKIDCIYSSDLLRAYNTALPTAKALGLEVIKTQELREIYVGKWEGHTTDEIAEKIAGVLKFLFVKTIFMVLITYLLYQIFSSMTRVI